ncbi:Kil family protein, partial [Trabulsiella guamensis ATCC 49490]
RNNTMITERIAEHISMAEAAQDWLRARGSRVTDVRVFMRRPLLEIACPPSELVRSANRITETHNGGTRSVWFATLGGCGVIWR